MEQQVYCLDCTWSNVRSHQLRICENCGSRNLVRESELLVFYKNNDTSSMRAEIEMLKAEIARLQAELDADDLMAGEAETFKPEYEKQLESENAYLKKQLRTERSILDNAPVWAEMANCPPETVIGIRYGRILEYQAEITRLQAQVATLERIITSNVEDSGHVGDSAKPYMNEVKTEIPSVGFIDEYSEEAILARMKEEEHD